MHPVAKAIGPDNGAVDRDATESDSSRGDRVSD
jgi:hypothetical protein